MKNFMIFIISFIVLFCMTQVLSGFFLTSIYHPNLSESWLTSSYLLQEISFGNTTFLPSIIMAVFSVIIAYFMTQLFKRFSNS
ncbi:hypothetical protein [Rummeliibacillus pycnus]|uniref:hypothetical protein n=1 Tax=Rummeliibacillus pycnus TaxID=101070 RepID=UPI003D2C4961